MMTGLISVNFYFGTDHTLEPLGVGIWWLTFCLLFLKVLTGHRWANPDNNDKKCPNLFARDVQCPRRPIRPTFNLPAQKKILKESIYLYVWVVSIKNITKYLFLLLNLVV